VRLILGGPVRRHSACSSPRLFPRLHRQRVRARSAHPGSVTRNRGEAKPGPPFETALYGRARIVDPARNRGEYSGRAARFRAAGPFPPPTTKVLLAMACGVNELSQLGGPGCEPARSRIRPLCPPSSRRGARSRAISSPQSGRQDLIVLPLRILRLVCQFLQQAARDPDGRAHQATLYLTL